MNPHIDMKAFDISEKKSSKRNYLFERNSKQRISLKIQNKYVLLYRQLTLGTILPSFERHQIPSHLLAHRMTYDQASSSAFS